MVPPVSDESQPAGGDAWNKPSFHIPFYDDVLKIVEVWLVLTLLLGVVFATFVNILDRNFQLGVWNYAVIEKMIYSAVFYIGIYGGVIAARRNKHIAIDAVATFLSLRQKRIVGIVLQAIAGVTCTVLMLSVHEWMMVIISADTGLVPGRDDWWLKVRLWRWPVVIGFGWMALHFFVNSGRFLHDTLRPPASDPGSDTASESAGEVSA
jgi:TRAP-type C4-dicarboxylate transport system permease small subunit